MAVITEILTELGTVAGITASEAISLQSQLSDDADGLSGLPHWYVMPLHERAEGNENAAGATRQTVTVSFVVITVSKVAELEQWRDELFDALHGKVFDQSRRISECVYVQGEVVDVTATAIWWRDVFSYRIRRCSSSGV